MPTNHIFSYFRGARAGCAPPGSAPDCVCNKLEAIIYYSKPQRGTPKHYGNSGTVIIHEYVECVFPNDSRAGDDCYRDAEIYWIFEIIDWMSCKVNWGMFRIYSCREQIHISNRKTGYTYKRCAYKLKRKGVGVGIWKWFISFENVVLWLFIEMNLCETSPPHLWNHNIDTCVIHMQK